MIRSSVLFGKVLKSFRNNAFCLYHNEISLMDLNELVESRQVPSITWNANILHGLTTEETEFRQMIRNFVEKELPEELVKKV